MHVSALIFAVLCGIALAIAAPARPDPTNVFSTGTQVSIQLPFNVTIHGHGLLVVDEPENRKYEMYSIVERTHQHLNLRLLDRFDLHRSYQVVDDRTCHTFQESGQMPSVWGWLKNATYEGQKRVDNVVLDVWGWKIGHGRVAVGVTPAAPNVPKYLFMDAPARNTTIKFLAWNTNKPDEKLFDIPKQCHQNAEIMPPAPAPASTLACVARATMLARGEAWVKINVPYSQDHYYEGYREDCSGFVSMCWETSKPGHTTSTMHEIAHPISKDQLQPGDVMLCAGEHVVLFVQWTSAAKTEYVYYAETTYGEGCVKRSSVYPYYYNASCFKPYRFDQVC